VEIPEFPVESMIMAIFVSKKAGNHDPAGINNIVSADVG
jgi:hypothetical protein